MKLEELHEQWNEDSEISLNLSREAIQIPKLHGRYFKILSSERLRLKKLESELKELKLDKTEFYTLGPTQEQHNKGWKLPACGKILKAEVNQYLESDRELIEQSLKIAYQQEKVEFLMSIISSLNNRGYLLRTILDYEKFKHGN